MRRKNTIALKNLIVDHGDENGHKKAEGKADELDGEFLKTAAYICGRKNHNGAEKTCTGAEQNKNFVGFTNVIGNSFEKFYHVKTSKVFFFIIVDFLNIFK